MLLPFSGVIFVIFVVILALLLLSKPWATSSNMQRVLIVLGSGGHTAEMLTLLKAIGSSVGRSRSYVVAATDKLSAQKAETYEKSLLTAPGSNTHSLTNFAIYKIPRSREVGQSYFTSLWTTLLAMAGAVQIVINSKPDLVLVNGPGTCIPICVAALMLRSFLPWQGQIVYIESIARVTTLSLSGKILYHLRIADLFFVQWPKLQSICTRSRYCGRLY